MSYSQESGYVPTDIATIMLSLMENINLQFGTAYTADSFAGTNFYKNAYAWAQDLQKNEIQTSEIFLKLQQYFVITNERISRPVVTNPGLIEKFLSEGYVASVKPMIDADAGKIFIAVDVLPGVKASGTITITSYANLITGTADTVTIGATVFTAQAGVASLGAGTFQAATSNDLTAQSLAAQINAHAVTSLSFHAKATAGGIVTLTALYGGTAGNALALNYTNNDANVGAVKSGATLTGGTAASDYAAKKLAINTIVKNSTVAGAVTQGSEVSTIVLSNGQSFDFKFNLAKRIPVLLRLTITLSENNMSVVGDPDTTKAKLLANIIARYRLGRNFEPQRYFSLTDAPWASQVLLEWSDDDGSPNWTNTIFDAPYDTVFDISLANITLVEV